MKNIFFLYHLIFWSLSFYQLYWFPSSVPRAGSQGQHPPGHQRCPRHRAQPEASCGGVKAEKVVGMSLLKGKNKYRESTESESLGNSAVLHCHFHDTLITFLWEQGSFSQWVRTASSALAWMICPSLRENSFVAQGRAVWEAEASVPRTQQAAWLIYERGVIGQEVCVCWVGEAQMSPSNP